MGKLNRVKSSIILLCIFTVVIVFSYQWNTVSAKKNLQSSGTIIQVPGDFANLQDAINTIPDGGVILIADGTYASPPGGFQIPNDTGKRFAIKSGEGATVVLDGGGVRDILRFYNLDVSTGGSVTFEGLIFANGYSSTEGVAGGVTLYEANATFKYCEFRFNVGNTNTTVGGGVYVAQNSNVFFYDTIWLSNSSRVGGGGLGVRGAAKVYIHQSIFINNSVNPVNHNITASGGAINVGNSFIRITNTRFENNQAGAFGGALYGIGNWVEPITTPKTSIILSNNTFINNQAIRHPSVVADFPTEGGGINVEDQTELQIDHSRFVGNRADIGGGVNVFRAEAEIFNSVFQGNQAIGTGFSSSFGGSISISSSDGVGDGNNNRPTARLLIEDSYIQGRYGGVITVAQTGGCLFAGGDGTRIDSNPDIPDMGSISDNRAIVDLKRVVFNDCDVSAISPNSGVGGALLVAIAELTMEDSLVMNSDSFGDTASGGGIAIIYHSNSHIMRTTIANNSVGKYGGGIFIQGSNIDLSDSNLFDNEVSPGVNEPVHESYGAAIFAAQDDGRNIDVTGIVTNSVFSNHQGLAIFDDDRTLGPINDVQYDTNTFYETTFGVDVYKNSLSLEKTVDELNTLVIVRDNGTSTTKSQVDNYEESIGPIPIAAVNASPRKILSTNAFGDDAPPTQSFLAFAWNGGTGAHFGGISLHDQTGVLTTTNPGSYQLSVDGTLVSDSAEILEESKSNVQFWFLSDYLFWSIQGITFIEMALDQGISVTSNPSGTVVVPPPFGISYHLYLITEEGGGFMPHNYPVFLPLLFR